MTANKRGFEYHKPGLNSTGVYMIPGVPYLSGSITIPARDAASGYGFKVELPTVSKSIMIRNDGSEVIWLGFSTSIQLHSHTLELTTEQLPTRPLLRDCSL